MPALVRGAVLLPLLGRETAMTGPDAELERRNLAADIAELETETGIGEPCCDGICIHHVRMERSG